MATPVELASIIDDLKGTCQSLHEVLEKHDLEPASLTQADHAAIDDEIFCCETCGWWYEVSEMGSEDDQICENCETED